jgi:hypothetical protein
MIQVAESGVDENKHGRLGSYRIEGFFSQNIGTLSHRPLRHHLT